MAKYEPMTKATPVDSAEFLDAVEPAERRADGKTLCALFEAITGEPPKMWGPSIVGFGSYDYKYDSGHEGTSCRLGFSPRKPELVLYVLTGTDEQTAQLARLGKHKVGKSCLYIKRLSDVDMGVLEEMIAASLAHIDAKYPKG